MLIACKCMPLCQKLDCDIKSEPPYLATTFNILITLNFMQWPRACNSMSKSQPTSTPNQHKLTQQFHTKFNQLKHESKLNKCSIYIPTLDPLLEEYYCTSYNTWKWLQQAHDWTSTNTLKIDQGHIVWQLE